MHLKRWITSLLAIPVLFLLITRGGPFAFSLLVSLISLVALGEYYRIVFPSEAGIFREPLVIPGLAAGLAVIWAAYHGSFEAILGILTVDFLLSGMMSVPRFGAEPAISRKAMEQVLGVVYIPVCLSCLVLIRNGESGLHWFFLVVCVVFAGDTGAFYAGSFFGKHKLCPPVSPGKTIEGSMGGLAFNVGTASVYKLLFLPELAWVHCILFSLVIGGVGQMGDLYESMLKRSAKIKDSGRILPGHGGMLDRIVALLFAAPVAYLFKVWLAP